MLGTLMKYEWRALRAPLLIMLCILGGTTLLSCGLIRMINPVYDEVVVGFSLTFAIFSIFLYYFGLIGCGIGITLVIAVRFYKTCYTDQGYLTHTLPVTADQTLAAKTIMAVLSALLVGLCMALTLIILVFSGLSHFGGIFRIYGVSWNSLLPTLFESINQEFAASMGIGFIEFAIWMAIMSVIQCICGVIHIFACVSLGQLYARHRILGAILAYFALMVVQNALGYISALPTFTKFFAAVDEGTTMTMAGVFGPSMVISLLISVALAVALYFVNLHMMTKRLNLE